MVSTLQGILLGIGAYWIVLIWLQRADRLPDALSTQGPIVLVHTKRFRSLVNRIARPKRAWRAWGNFGIGVFLVVMIGSFAFLLFAASVTLRDPGQATAVNQPRNVLVIPGVNDFLPLSAAPEIVFGLLVGLVLHEGGHGIMSRVGDIDIESMGIALFTIVPVAAFVEPDDESRKAAPRGDQSRMFAAGVTNNFAITLVAYILLFGPVIGAIGVAPGAAVGGSLPGSAADRAGIGQGDRIITIEGQAIEDNAALEATLSSLPDREVAVEVADGRTTKTVTVERSLLVTGVTLNTPFASAVDRGMRITAVNGTEVHTEQALGEALRERTVVELSTEKGESVTGPIGAAVQISPDGPAVAAGLTGETTAVITAIDGQRVASASDLSRVMATTEPGQTVEIVLYIDGERRVEAVSLGEHPAADIDHGYIGVEVAPGYSGLTVSDFGTRLYPAAGYLSILGGGGGGGGSFFGRIASTLLLPFAAVAGGLPFNWAGFTGGIGNFYVVTGPLKALGGLVFTLANALFWTAWINLNLGIFNCIPAFPLDGGHILRMATEAIVARLPIRDRRRATTAVTTSIGVIMLITLILTLFGPQLLN